MANSVEILFKTLFDSRGADRANESLRGTGQTAQGAAGQLDALVGGLTAAGIAYGAVEVAQQTWAAAIQGQAIKLEEARFDSLTQSIGTNERAIESLRIVTRGQATDLDLMAGANQLMVMGLADSQQSLEDHFRIISALKKPNEDLGTAIENWSLLLANQSIDRLDSFGISSGRVRERIDELQRANANMTRETAFMIATMEEAEKTVDKLGDAVTEAEDPFARLTVRVQNLTDKGKVMTANMLLPLVTQLDIATDSTERWNARLGNLTRFMHSTTVGMLNGTTVANLVVSAFRDGEEATDDLTTSTDNLASTYAALSPLQHAAIAGHSQGAVVAAANSAEIRQLTADLIGLTEAMGAANAVNSTIKQGLQRTGITGQAAYEDLEAALNSWAGDASDLTQQVEQQTRSYGGVIRDRGTDYQSLGDVAENAAERIIKAERVKSERIREENERLADIEINLRDRVAQEWSDFYDEVERRAAEFTRNQADEFLGLFDDVQDNAAPTFEDLLRGFADMEAASGDSADAIRETMEGFLDTEALEAAARLQSFIDAFDALSRSDLNTEEKRQAIEELQRQFAEGEEANLENYGVAIEDANEYARRTTQERLDDVLAMERDTREQIEQAQNESSARIVAINQQANQQIKQSLEQLGDAFNREFGGNISTAEGLRSKLAEVQTTMQNLTAQEYNVVVNYVQRGAVPAGANDPAQTADSHIRP